MGMDEQIVGERDAAEEAVSQAYYLVTGRSPEWSNKFGYQQALDDIADAAGQLKRAVELLRRAKPEIFLASQGNPALVAEIDAFIASRD